MFVCVLNRHNVLGLFCCNFVNGESAGICSGLFVIAVQQYIQCVVVVAVVCVCVCLLFDR